MDMVLNFEVHGDGFPLIILHGLFGSLENWRTMGREFARRHRVFLVDLRNHGGSPHSEDMNYAFMAEDLKAFMEQQALPSAFVLGHSMGGKTAMHLAVTWPELVAKLVVVDIAPKAYHGGHLELLDALLSLDLGRYRQRGEIDAALSAAIPERAVRQFLLKNLVSEPCGGYSWRINLQAIARGYGHLMQGLDAGKGYEKPTLFVKGERSQYIRQGDWDSITRFFPLARLVSIPNAGHWVHAEAPHEFLNAVLSFLDSA